MEESSHASNMHDYHHNVKSKRYKKADIWYYILLYATDIVSVLSSFVMLLLFADWILFVAPVRVMPVISYHIILYRIT